MQQLTIEHEKLPKTNQIVGNEDKKTKDRRPGKGRVLALSRRIYRLQNTDVFYIESETSDDMYYYVKFKPAVFEWCSCPDNSTRHVKCKHIFAIEYAIMKGTLKDIDKLPKEAEIYPQIITNSYREDQYDF